MSTPAQSTASPLATTIAPGVARTLPPVSNVIDFFTTPVTTGDEHDVKLALAAGATREELGVAPNLTKEDATPAAPGGEAGAGDEEEVDTGNRIADTGSQAGRAEGAAQRIVREQVTKMLSADVSTSDEGTPDKGSRMGGVRSAERQT